MTPEVPRARVSVVIPSWQAERYIAQTIASVRAQSLTAWELVVVDDASSDGTVEAARRAAGDDDRIRIEVNQSNLGPAANWNLAVSMTTAPFVKLLCSDDVLLPRCLERQVDALDAHPSAGMAAARRDVIDGAGRIRFAGRGLQGLQPFMDGRSAVRAAVRVATTPFGEPSVVLLRRRAVDEAGPFTERYGTLIDLDFYTRLLRRWDCAAVDETLVQFRMSAASWSDRSHQDQGRNARRLLRDLADDPEFGISSKLLAMGLTRTFVNRWARQAAFAVHRGRTSNR
jgi:glycosyltransferase involved in cell wall biosynthesis